MKNILYVLLIISIFLSHKGYAQQRDGRFSPTPGENLIQKFKPFIQGVWVKSSYVNGISKTKSPYKSRNNLNGVAAMYIKIPSGQIDSVDIGYSVNNHEASDFMLYSKTGRISTSLKTALPDYDLESNFYELGYSMQGKVTTLILYHYNKSRKIIDKTSYTKVANKATDTTDAAWGIQYITNAKVMNGTYITRDSLGNRLKVKFDSEGRMSGLYNFSSFLINTDFVVSYQNNLDEIIFDIDSKHGKFYTFKIKADTLKLYDTQPNTDSSKDIIGRLKYKFVRKK